MQAASEERSVSCQGDKKTNIVHHARACQSARVFQSLSLRHQQSSSYPSFMPLNASTLILFSSLLRRARNRLEILRGVHVAETRPGAPGLLVLGQWPSAGVVGGGRDEGHLCRMLSEDWVLHGEQGHWQDHEQAGQPLL